MTTLLLAAGLWAAPAHAEKNKPCWVPTRMRYAGRSTLEFTSLEDAIRREQQAAKLEMREAREIRAPWISVRVERLTLDGADPVHQLVVVHRDGVEVHRYQPPSVVPNIGNDHLFQFWWAYAVVQLPEGVAPPLEVSAIDTLHQTKCVWKVEADGTIALVDKVRGYEEE